MKLNEVLDVFGNESLDTVMTPEQEYEASVESLIEEIDSVMNIKEGLESMEAEAVSMAQMSCESLLTGLAVREISIANEDADLAYICNAFNVKPELFGLEADEATMKEKIKDKAGRAYRAVNNSRVVKAVKWIIKRIVTIIMNFFSLDNVFSRMILGIIKGLANVAKTGSIKTVSPSDILNRLKAFFNVVDRYNDAKNFIKSEINRFKNPEFKMSPEDAQKFVDDIISRMNFGSEEISEEGIGESLNPKMWIQKLKDLRNKMKASKEVSKEEIEEAVKDIEPSIGKKIIAAFQKLMTKIKEAAKKAGAAVVKAFKDLKDKAKGAFKKKEAGAEESVAFGTEALDSLFGEISRLNYAMEGEDVVPEEYAEIGVEGMNFFEDLDALEDTMEALESIEELYIEATIPSQLAALESIAIEKGLNPDNGVSFDLFGTMSAGIEAADEVVEKSSEETKKTLKDRAAGAFGKVKSVVTSAFAFIKNKFIGLSSAKKALKAIKAGLKQMTPEEMKAFMAENSANMNRILVLTNVVKVFMNPFAIALSLFAQNPLADKNMQELEELRAKMKEAMKIEDSKSNVVSQIDSRLIDMAVNIMDKFEKKQKGFIANARVIKGHYKMRGGVFILGPIKDYLRMCRDMAKDFGKVLMNGLKASKDILKQLGGKIKSRKAKDEANQENAAKEVTEQFA